VTSVVFSITIVALTLAAGQFGSRVLRNFMRDRGNQITLGTFIATFVYAMLVLRTVRGGDDAEFVPPPRDVRGHPPRLRERGGADLLHSPRGELDPGGQRRGSIALETEDAIERLFPGTIGREDPEGDRTESGEQGGTYLPTRFDADAKAVRALRGTISRSSIKRGSWISPWRTTS
jgi:hypothetical protein